MAMDARQARLLEDVRTRAGLADGEAAFRTVTATLSMLGECLPAAQAAALAEALPPESGEVVRATPRHQAIALQELFEHVSQRARVPYGAAMEHAEAVLAVIAGQVSPELRLMLQRQLPPAWARLFEPRAIEGRAPEPWPHHRAGRGETLADGRPGSRHPLSEAGPPAAQGESVAAPNPHGDTKLSSAAPPAVDDSLAEGRPGSAAPLAEAGERRRGR
jgi:uncharacterized protein (DUF2267 family)